MAEQQRPSLTILFRGVRPKQEIIKCDIVNRKVKGARGRISRGGKQLCQLVGHDEKYFEAAKSLVIQMGRTTAMARRTRPRSRRRNPTFFEITASRRRRTCRTR
eukprot:8973918-Pyramimonas_sp.AAC.1